MKIAVFGANGPTGRLIVTQALAPCIIQLLLCEGSGKKAAA
ncbi:hypothetical protein [Humibacter sp. RRB41]|nr:hypothetical protein [Humibacter sp. RRB41]